jgi:hypothetical protein
VDLEDGRHVGEDRVEVVGAQYARDARQVDLEVQRRAVVGVILGFALLLAVATGV